jgi:hypothetical protein
LIPPNITEMRLLDVESFIYGGATRLIECSASHAPPYAILSHTWSSEEVLFQDVALGPDYDLHETPIPYQPKHISPKSRLYQLIQSQPSATCEECRLKQSNHSSKVAPKSRGRPKAGWNKVANACLRACMDGYQYIWIDTCCIDKSSSAELSEAINSMFEWYARSKVCYVYLEDCVDCPLRTREDERLPWFLRRLTLWTTGNSGMSPCLIAQLRSCKWLTRGWTLQELIAPCRMTFVDQNWVPIFNRSEVQHILHDITGIARGLFDRENNFISVYEDNVSKLQKRLRQLSVVEKMSWVGSRQTTRSEDMAYCLLGIFGVNIPLLYGEGERAFSRLQDAIMKVNVDQTILAWECEAPMWSDTRMYKDMLLAPSPMHFNWWRSFKRKAMETALSTNEPSIIGSTEFPESFELTNAGLLISLRCPSASTIRRKAVRFFSTDSEERSHPTLAQVPYRDEHNEHSDDKIDEDHLSGNIGSEENGETDHNNTSTSISNGYGTTDEDHYEARRSHEDGVSCALLDCKLELGGTTYAIAIQLQHTQTGDRYKASPAVDEGLFKHGRNAHRLLFVNAEAVEGTKRRAMLIRHDHTAWY